MGGPMSYCSEVLIIFFTLELVHNLLVVLSTKALQVMGQRSISYDIMVSMVVCVRR